MIYRCTICNRRLKENRWVYSSHTGNRFCWPGEGCAKTNGGPRKRGRRRTRTLTRP